MAFFPPWLAVLSLPVLTLMGCTAAGLGNEASEVHPDGALVAVEDQKRLAQCERMERLLGDQTLTQQQIEAVRARMDTNGCFVP
jgi:hypothetical protein